MAELSKIADWALRTLTGMPGTSPIVPIGLIRAVIGEPRDDHDVLQELLDAGRAVRLDGTHYQLDVVMQPASEDLIGYGTLLMWHAIEAARADLAVNPRGWRLGFVYERAGRPYGTPDAAVKWFRDNESRLMRMLNGAAEYGLDDVVCELAEPLWSLSRYVGHHHAAAHTQFATINVLNTFADDKQEHRRATALARAASALSCSGMHDEAIANADSAVRHATTLDDPQVLSIAKAARGRAHEFAGNLRIALEDYEAALALAEQVEDPRSIALRHRRIGVLRAKLDDLDAAITHLRTAERLMKQIGDDVGCARVRIFLAQAQLDDGHAAEACATIAPVFEVLRAAANDLYIAEAAAVAGAAAEHTNPAVARAHYILAITSFNAYGLPSRAADVQRQFDLLNQRSTR